MSHEWLDELMSMVRDHGQVYVIEMKKNQHDWFFHMVSFIDDSHTPQVYWTPGIKHAHLFMTEEIVEEFKHEFINPRKASIIRIPAIDMLLSLQ